VLSVLLLKKMLEILQCTFVLKHAKGGRKPKLPLEEQQLLATLEYIREYQTYAHIAASYQIDESNMYRMIRWVEDTLIKDGTSSLPGRALLKSDMEYEVVLIDAAESLIERPKKGQKYYYSDKKKRCTIKGSSGCKQSGWSNNLHFFYQWVSSCF
jgi:hypothetical protein